MRNTTFVMQNIVIKWNFFNILEYGGGSGPKQLSSMHKQTTLKDIIQLLNFIKINI